MQTLPIRTWLVAWIAALGTIALLKVGKTIFMPMTVSLFLAFVLLPVVEWGKRLRVPVLLSSALSLAGVLGGIVSMALLLVLSLRTMADRIPFYVVRAKALVKSIERLAMENGIQMEKGLLTSAIDPDSLSDAARAVALQLVNLSKDATLIFFITLFLLLESQRIKQKLSKIFGSSAKFQDSIRLVVIQVQRYLFLKTLISLSTGLVVWGFLAWKGVDFALVWGFLAFVLNFIPNVGSIVATLPPVVLATMQFDNPVGAGIAVLAGLMAIQVVIGNFLDPRIMGESLNLSTLAIFLNLCFWGWLWGPMGMLISVPIIVVAKASLDYLPITARYSAMLDG